MRALWPTLNRYLVWFHRWGGVVLCLLFAVWFASGAVLHFVGFPALSDDERVARSEPIDLSRLRIDPSTALAHRPGADQLRLISVLGRPVYLVSALGAAPIAVAGDSGALLAPLTAAAAERVAAQFDRARAAAVAGPFDYDQWIVHQHFDPYRPFFRVRLDDPGKTDLYVSARLGEVWQKTTASERMWNWLGAVIHWIYFTPLRKSWSAWNQVVWWVSLVALLSSIAGVWLGTVRLVANRSAGRRGLSPFRGWMRWHHVIGLFASVVVLAWIFSGWLSMDHGRLFSKGIATTAQVQRVRGTSFDSTVGAASLTAVQAAGPASEISFHAIAGRAFLESQGGGVPARITWLTGGRRAVDARIPDLLLLAGVRQAWPTAEPIGAADDEDDALYRLAESLPLQATAFWVPGKASTRVYLDRDSGEILVVMDPSRRAYAWIYYALHTLNFPALIDRPLARTVLVLLLLAGGLGFVVTGVVLAVRRVKLELA